MISPSKLKRTLHKLRVQIYTLYYVARDPATPWYVKLLLLAVVTYLLSPIDLIPDFIPVLGYLDDAMILPVGVWLAKRLMPDDVLQRCRERARLRLGDSHQGQ